MTQELNRLTKKINSRRAEALKNLATKNQVETALDLGDKNREKQNNFKRLI